MIYFFIEDELSKIVIGKVFEVAEKETGHNVQKVFHITNGYGKIKANLLRYNNMAKRFPVIVVVDLDNTECAPIKIKQWMKFKPNRNLIFRVVVREIESWLFADKKNFAKFLGISDSVIPYSVEDIKNPKEKLVSLARTSRKRVIKDDIPPEIHSKAKLGKNYTGRLAEFVLNHWDVNTAKQTDSLNRALNSFVNFLSNYDADR